MLRRGLLHVFTISAAFFALAVLTGGQSFAQGYGPPPNAYTIANVNMRAGPGIEYPRLLTVPRYGHITILGCLVDHRWCDVVYRGIRGWMSALYLMGYYEDGYYALRDYAPQMGYPTVRFDIDAYWGAHYRSRPFYAERARWKRARGHGWVEVTTFYDPLSRYGDWLWFQGQYVWVPADVDPYWRPYTIGRWVYTEPYGWMWVSYEPFGWAVYHYGRWGYSRRIGWFWVPANRWGPAWVSWRETDDYLAWAPLPPAYNEYVSLQISVGDIPDYYWSVVPARSFLSVNLSVDLIRDRRRYRPILEESKPLGSVTIVNNVVVNNVVNVTYVEEKTEKKVVVHEVAETEKAAGPAKVEDNKVEIFVPPPEPPKEEAAPPEVKTLEEVEKESPTKEQVTDAPTTEELLLPPEVKPAADAPPPPPSIEEAKPIEAPPPPEEAAPLEEAAPAEKPAEEKPAEEKPTEEKPAEEKAPPAPKEEEAPPPPVKEEIKPEEKAPPPPEEEAPPPPPEKEAPPPPPVKEEVKPEVKPKEKAPPPPPKEETPPPPPEEGAPPPPLEEEAPLPNKEAPKLKPLAPEVQPQVLPLPPVEEPEVKKEPPKEEPAAQPATPEAPPPPPEEEAPPAPDGLPVPCPEGTVLQPDGSCVPPPE